MPTIVRQRTEDGGSGEALSAHADETDSSDDTDGPSLPPTCGDPAISDHSLQQHQDGSRLGEAVVDNCSLQRQQDTLDLGEHVSANQHIGKNNAGASASLLPKNSSPRSASQSKLGEKGSPASLRNRILCDTWFYEYVAMCISIACLIAIGVVLMVYDQRPSPQLKYGLTLNAIISVLATGTESGIAFAIGSSVSQLKWCWVQKRQRSLEDLQAYDDASRGFSGAITMLFKRSGRSLVSIGALITILAVAFDPFVQQLLTYPLRNVPSVSSSALTKQAAVFNATGADIPFPDAVEAGLWADSTQFARDPICTSGNCTWSPFGSVGWCSKCEDVTLSASISGCNFSVDMTPAGRNNSHGRAYIPSLEVPCRILLDKGAPVDLSFWVNPFDRNDTLDPTLYTYIPNQVVWMVYDTQPNGFLGDLNYVLSNATFNGVENPLMVLAHASLHLAQEKDPRQGLAVSRVEQCVLSLCEKTYETSVANGVPSSTVLSTNWGGCYLWDLKTNKTVYTNPCVTPKSTKLGMYWTANPDETANVHFPRVDGVPVNADPDHFASMIDWDWSASINSYVTGIGAFEWTRSFSPNNSWVKISYVNYSSDAMEAIVPTGLSTVLGNVAASLTRLGLDESNRTISGTIFVSEVFVDVRWEWFILPCFLELAGGGFLIATIIVSKRQKVLTWKSSLYVLLYHGLEREVLENHPTADTISGMEQVARSTTVRLKMSDHGDRIALGR